jgi:hypothetical protein
MSDTQIFGKTVSGTTKAMILYVIADIVISLSQNMAGMDQAKWESMWWMQKSAFWLAQIGSAALICKAFYSNSSKQ